MASFCFSSIKSDTFYGWWFCMVDLRVYKGDYSNVAVYFWNVLNHFLKVREFSFWILDFLDDEVDLETNIDCVEFVKSTAGLEFNHRDFTFWFWFFNFWNFLVLPWAVILYFGKPRHQFGVLGLRGVFYSIRYTDRRVLVAVHEVRTSTVQVITAFRLVDFLASS